MGTRQQGFRSFAEAAAPAKTVWTPVVNPDPVFDGSDEKRRYEQALADTPRAEGEDICDWLARVGAAARPIGDRQLPPGDRESREPGAED
jgi:hypothetical protein